MASSILINHLIVVGTKKNYTVNFNAGVNIIYGDSATGKSSILNLIDYLFGAKRFDLYPEIESAGRYAVLDVTLNDDRYSIKRDIFSAAKPIEVFPCSYDKIEQFAVKKYLPTFQPNSNYPDMEFFSEFLFSALNLTNLKIKQAPSKDESKLTRLSFRDIIKYCYVDQDDLGSKKFLRPDNYALQVKNAEVFKYLFNALDSQISELEQNISDKTQKRNALDKKFQLVSEFLRESEFGNMVSLDDEITKIDNDISLIEEQIEKLNHRNTADDEVYSAIKSTMSEISLESISLQHRMFENEQKIERFTRLKNEYFNDIAKFKSSLEAREIIGDVAEEIALCPVCDNTLQLGAAKQRFKIAPEDKIKQELNFLKKRIKDTEQIVGDCKKQWEIDKSSLNLLTEDEQRARKLIDQNTKELTSPYLAERDMFVSQLGEFGQKRTDLVTRLKVRNQHNLLTVTMKSLETSIDQLKDRLEQLKKDAPSMTVVLSNLANNLKEYLDYVKIKDPSGISFTTDKFVPVVRGIEYGNITSGGLRTIVGIGYLCSLMQEALTTQMSYPSFLMIDTVGKYLGKTKTQIQYKDQTSKEDDSKEAVSDPLKYQNIFEYIIQLADKYEQENKVCQFILVDNDVPDHIIGNLSGFIVAHFSSERVNGLPVGFIDDATD